MRIDTALRRAAGQADSPVPALPPEAARQAAGNGSDLFGGPWTFEAARPDRPDDTERPVGPPGFSVLAGPDALFHGFAPEVAEKVVVGDRDGDRAAMAVSIEQFRGLAATLHHAQIERSIRVVMVTSAIAGEGKSLTSTNLALTLSESYRRRVLLIDADLRRPALHQIFQVPNVSGLHDGLRNESEPRLSLIEITPHLTLLPAGQPDPDPMSVLTSPRMRRIIKEASACYDWVIVDAPPIGLLTDASLLGEMVDAALLVIQAGGTDYPIVKRAVDAIGRDRILGVVLNRVDAPESTYGYKYGKYYAGYYSSAKPIDRGQNP
jgi:capsular exopolysaccharide synthesis family protein